MEYMTAYQKELYKERDTMNKTSRTFNSSVFPNTQNGIDASSSLVINNAPCGGNYREENVRTPWGRSRSYAGDGPIYLPTNHRPKREPPPVLQRTHQHFGSGLFPHPRGYPFVQFYDLTHLKKSDVRSSDELIPRPSTSQVHDKQIKVEFPQEHPLSSHMSRQEMFPKFHKPIIVDCLSKEDDDPEPTVSSLPSLVPAPSSTIVVQKVMGNFARREIYTPQTSTMRPSLTFNQRKVGRLQIENPWFSRHEVMSQFNKQNPTVIPKIALNIQKKKQPSWLVYSESTI